MGLKQAIESVIDDIAVDIDNMAKDGKGSYVSVISVRNQLVGYVRQLRACVAASDEPIPFGLPEKTWSADELRPLVLASLCEMGLDYGGINDSCYASAWSREQLADLLSKSLAGRMEAK